MRGTKYYYVKMNRGKRHFVPLADSQGRPVLDLAEAIRAASKAAMNPFVERLSRSGVLNEFFDEKLRKREWEATTKRGHRHIYKPLSQVSQTRSVQLPPEIFRNGTTSSAPACLITRPLPTSRALSSLFR
jgi:hypothetical protein